MGATDSCGEGDGMPIPWGKVWSADWEEDGDGDGAGAASGTWETVGTGDSGG